MIIIIIASLSFI